MFAGKKTVFASLWMLVLAGLLTGCNPPTPDPPKPDPKPQDTTVTPDPPIPPVEVIGDIDSLLKTMTIREKVGQMFYVRPECLDTTIDMQGDYVSVRLQAVN